MVAPLDERLARTIGTLCGRAGTGDVVDASVVVVAQLVGGAIVTGIGALALWAGSRRPGMAE
jgi:hypothetical protein